MSGVPISALYGGWIAKMAAATLYSAMLVICLRFFETRSALAWPESLLKVFDHLTFPRCYEDFLQKICKETLTGSSDWGQFEAVAQSLINRSLADRKTVGILNLPGFES